MSSNNKLDSIGTPVAELKIDTALVSNLLKQQYPDLAHLPIRLLDSGWDNIMFRLGDLFCVRLPRRQSAAILIENKQIWLSKIASQLTIAVPTPCRIGQPSANFPWKWSILPWLNGVTANQEQPHPNQAKQFALFLRSLHLSAPSNAPANAVRGIPLKQRSVDLERRIQRLEHKTNFITQKIKNIWRRAVNIPIDVEPKWLHGDLHPGNILVKNGVIVAIIDWGDLTSGDIATDLAAIWMLFRDRHARETAIAQYLMSEQTLHRAKGWAIYFAVTLLDVGIIDNPRQAIIGEQTLRCLVEDG